MRFFPPVFDPEALRLCPPILPVRHIQVRTALPDPQQLHHFPFQDMVQFDPFVANGMEQIPGIHCAITGDQYCCSQEHFPGSVNHKECKQEAGEPNRQQGNEEEGHPKAGWEVLDLPLQRHCGFCCLIIDTHSP